MKLQHIEYLQTAPDVCRVIRGMVDRPGSLHLFEEHVEEVGSILCTIAFQPCMVRSTKDRIRRMPL